ncbi:hypothetical protein BO78DRAFT_397726 [Aspergillus sclerotiicarbonarius CBS 121057]|uniref:Uncharacterized protein n=1 Tax=Aspergillus sclerotiicarbonarius (strain CBS 121057 / IBT 28362) TaxID=1448318 RepID=A0A319EH69_ASPSB|nr:hypothetical protein BO78DRAFT_397726 [Aspergillus sclerotiicarbonarius CBS 121057]
MLVVRIGSNPWGRCSCRVGLIQKAPAGTDVVAGPLTLVCEIVAVLDILISSPTGSLQKDGEVCPECPCSMDLSKPLHRWLRGKARNRGGGLRSQADMPVIHFGGRAPSSLLRLAQMFRIDIHSFRLQIPPPPPAPPVSQTRSMRPWNSMGRLTMVASPNFVPASPPSE